MWYHLPKEAVDCPFLNFKYLSVCVLAIVHNAHYTTLSSSFFLVITKHAWAIKIELQIVWHPSYHSISANSPYSTMKKESLFVCVGPGRMSTFVASGCWIFIDRPTSNLDFLSCVGQDDKKLLYPRVWYTCQSLSNLALSSPGNLTSWPTSSCSWMHLKARGSFAAGKAVQLVILLKAGQESRRASIGNRLFVEAFQARAACIESSPMSADHKSASAADIVAWCRCMSNIHSNHRKTEAGLLRFAKPGFKI